MNSYPLNILAPSRFSLRYRGPLLGPFLSLLLLTNLGCASRAHLADLRRLESRLETGDLVFLDLDCGEICDAIEDVTLEQFKVSAPRLSHMGMIERTNTNEFKVVEAWPDGGVHEVSLRQFLNRVKAGENQAGGFYVGHFKPKHREHSQQAFIKIKGLIGRPYDDEFILKNGKYYCSELIVEGFNRVQHPIFKYRPMEFGKPGSPQHKAWKHYYSKLGEPIPEKKPGLSPLGIYLAGRSTYFE